MGFEALVKADLFAIVLTERERERERKKEIKKERKRERES